MEKFFTQTMLNNVAFEMARIREHTVSNLAGPYQSEMIAYERALLKCSTDMAVVQVFRNWISALDNAVRP